MCIDASDVGKLDEAPGDYSRISVTGAGPVDGWADLRRRGAFQR